MKSKISYFNKTIFKKNLTLYWPLWTAYLLYMLACIPVSLYQNMHGYVIEPATRQYSALRSIFSIGAEPVTISVFSVMAIMAVFSYLYTAKNANGIHGLPVTRLELFVTNAFSAFTCLAVAELIAFIAGVFVGISCGVTKIEILFFTFLYQLGITFFCVAFGTCIAMLTGHIMALPLYFYVANFLYVIVRYVLENLILELTYGLTDLWGIDKSYVLSPIYYLSEAINARVKYQEGSHVAEGVMIEGGMTVAAYAGIGVILFVLAYRMYRKRQLELAGDIIAVGFMKPIFRFGVGICGGTTLGLILAELFYFETVKYSTGRFLIKLIYVVVCNLIGFFAAEMLMQKNFRIFKKNVLIEAFASVGIIAVLMCGIQMDAFGLEKQLPAADEVVVAYADMDYPVVYEGEDAKELLVIHKQILDEKEQTLKNSALDMKSSNVTFRYVLKDGTIFTRSYAIIIDEENMLDVKTPGGKLLAKEMEPERFMQHLLGVNYETNKYLTGSIYLYDEHQNHYEYRLSEEELKVLAEAIKKDIANGSIANYELYSLRRNGMSTDQFINDININYYNEEKIVRVEDAYYSLPTFYYQDFNFYGAGDLAAVETVEQSIYFDAKYDTSNFYLGFGEKCINLISALEELGIVNETWHLYTNEEYQALFVDEK